METIKVFKKLQSTKLLLCALTLLVTLSTQGSELLFAKEEVDGHFSETLLASKTKNKTPVNLDEGRKVKLGSLWKLYVYIYLVDNKMNPPDYQCTGFSVEEKFCCSKGGAINMDKALIKSCSLYFAPTRLQISPDEWKTYWSQRVSSEYEWLLNYSKFEADTAVSVSSLLESLKRIRLQRLALERLEQVLSQVTVQGTGRQGLKELGTTLKFKTFSWRQLGGAAGWMPDGRAFYLSAKGKSSDVLQEWSKVISRLTNIENMADQIIVKVNFFERYPIVDINEEKSGRSARPGFLKGRFVVHFENGKKISLESDNKIFYQRKGNKAELSGKFSMDEYVARVIDREISPQPEEAAKAFSILIRTFLINNAKKSFKTYEIEDSTRFQRVSINGPSSQSMKVARWGHDLILKETFDLTYHLNEEGVHKLSWAKANNLASHGSNFLDILKTHYEIEKLAHYHDDLESCQRKTFLENWIKINKKNWKKSFANIEGFSEPGQVKVCQSQNGKQYADLERNTIYLNEEKSTEDLITAAHEYLHLAFKNHPRTNNEDEIEALAKKLAASTREIL